MICERSPERDDFETCDECCEMISTVVIHTLTQEIDHYLGENLKISELTNSDCYHIKKILEDSRHLVDVAKLRLKIIDDNT